MGRVVGLGAAMVLSLVGCTPPSVGSAPGGGPAGQSSPARATAGDTVYLIEHFVRPERRAQFEEFVEQVLWPAFQRTASANPARAPLARQTRLLRPVAPNADGTFTFTFVLDPVVQGESYNVLDVLREAYPTAGEAEQQYARFTETWARDFTARPFVQSP